MATLLGTKIKDTYNGLLKLIDNVGLTATAKEITDGDGVGSGVFVANDGSLKAGAIHSTTSMQNDGGYKDSTGALGTTGQVLESTGTVTTWATTAAVDATMGFAASDRTTPIVVAASGGIFAPHNMTLEDLFGGLETVGTTSGVTTIMIKKNGVDMLSTAITIDFGESTSLTAATAPVISVTGIVKGDWINTDITGITGGGTEAGLQITLNGKRA